MNEKDHIALLIDFVHDINKMLAHYKNSLERVRKIPIGDDYTEEQYEVQEAFTARFSRLADFVTSKFLRTILILLREDTNVYIDRANILEKLEIIPSAEEIIAIKDMRNSIVHDYWIDEIKDNFVKVRKLGEPLLHATLQSIAFCKKRGWLT